MQQDRNIYSFCSYNMVKLSGNIHSSAISLKRLRAKFIYSRFQIKIS